MMEDFHLLMQSTAKSLIILAVCVGFTLFLGEQCNW